MVQKFDFQELDLKGAYLIKPFFATDDRGGLIKDYNVDTFKANGIDHELKEVFFTLSKRGVICNGLAENVAGGHGRHPHLFDEECRQSALTGARSAE